MVSVGAVAALTTTEPSGSRAMTTPPARTVAPSGTSRSRKPMMRSEPSRSVAAPLTRRPMALSSLPAAVATRSVGASATGSTRTVKLAVVLAVLMFWSRTVAVIVRRISPEKSRGGVMVTRPRSATGIDQLPLPSLVPWLRLAPAGTPERATTSRSDPSRSVSWAPKFRAMGLSSLPATLFAKAIGASATAFTETELVPVMVRVTVVPSPVSLRLVV